MSVLILRADAPLSRRERVWVPAGSRLATVPRMTGMEILAAATSIWAVAMAVSPSLQIRQMLRTRSSEDVSVGYFLVLVVGFLLWVAYGWATRDPVLYVPNTIAVIVGTATIVIALRFRRSEASTEDQP